MGFHLLVYLEKNLASSLNFKQASKIYKPSIHSKDHPKQQEEQV